jgi:hypothetical protein
VHNAGRMLPRINTLFALPALCDLGLDALYTRKKLRLAIECGQHDVAPLPPARVIAVVMDNKAPDTVVVRLNSPHRPKANSRHRHPKAPKAQHRSAPITSDFKAGDESRTLRAIRLMKATHGKAGGDRLPACGSLRERMSLPLGP